MADEDSGIDLGEDSETAAAPAKKGGLGGILPTILKYVALALGAIVLIVTVVIITMNVMGGNKTRQTQVPISEEYKEYAEENFIISQQKRYGAALSRATKGAQEVT